MEKGKIYVFYNNAYLFNKKEDDSKVMVGEYLGEDENKIMAFKIDNKNTIRYSNNVYDELDTDNTAFNFIEYLAAHFQNKFQRNVSVWQEDYEFKISIPRYYLKDIIPLSKIVNIMDYILEDWFSSQWCELTNNNIQFKMDSVLVSFRVTDVHEIQFRYNEEVK